MRAATSRPISIFISCFRVSFSFADELKPPSFPDNLVPSKGRRHLQNEARNFTTPVQYLTYEKHPCSLVDRGLVGRF